MASNSRVKVQWAKAAPVDYDLAPSMTLARHIEELCKLFQSPGASADYTLQVIETGVYITQEVYESDGLDLALNTVLELKIQPTCAVRNVLSDLRDGKKQKKAIFDLRTVLQDDVFAQEFVAQDGMTVVLEMVEESTGNLLAYALASLQASMKWSAYETLPPNVLQKIANGVNSNNFNVIKASLEILKSYVADTDASFNSTTIVRAAFTDVSEDKSRPYNILLDLLQSTDVNIQIRALALVNAFLERANENEKAEFCDNIEAANLNRTLHRQEGIESDEYKKEISRYQRIRMAELRDLVTTPFNPDDEEHEAMLLKVWHFIYPNEVLTERENDKWKTLGFTGADPAPDFAETGLLGLYHLMYNAENHPVALRRLINVQSERPEKEYPVALASLKISKILADFFKIAEENHNSTSWFTILFDHNEALSELYCTSLQVFDRMWDEMDASFMDFNKMIAIARKQFDLCLRTMPTTLSTFKNTAFSTTQVLCESEGTIDDKFKQVAAGEMEAAPIAEIRKQMIADLLDSVRAQRIEYIREGDTFYDCPQGKNEKPSLRFFRLAQNGKEIRYGDDETQVDNQEKILISNVADILIGSECPDIAAAKRKIDATAISLSFAIVMREAINEIAHVHMQAKDEVQYTVWLDGLRCLLNPEAETESILDDVNTLASLELTVRFVELDGGAVVPETTPEVPEPPPNFDFASERESTGDLPGPADE